MDRGSGPPAGTTRPNPLLRVKAEAPHGGFEQPLPRQEAGKWRHTDARGAPRGRLVPFTIMAAPASGRGGERPGLGVT